MVACEKINLQRKVIMKKLVLAATITAISSIGSISVANAAETTFVGGTVGKTWSRVTSSQAAKDNLEYADFNNVFNQDDTWGVRAGKDFGDRRYYATYDYTSGAAHHNKLVQENLIGSADYIIPLNDYGTRAFAGVSAGVNSLKNNTSGYTSNRSYGFTYGAQAGLLQTFAENFEVEGGVKYMLNNNNVDFREDGDKVGTATLKNNKELYVGLNYHF
jgi:hypothetical protein